MYCQSEVTLDGQSWVAPYSSDLVLAVIKDDEELSLRIGRLQHPSRILHVDKRLDSA
jgi:hypothetical protein